MPSCLCSRPWRTYLLTYCWVPMSSCASIDVSLFFFFFSSRRRHTRLQGDWSSDVCSSDLVALSSVAVHALDSSVGFSAAPSSAKLAEANDAVGVNSVVGAWAFQGSRAAVSKGQILNAQGNYINSVRAADGRQTWQAEVVGLPGTAGGAGFLSPAAGRAYSFLA